MNTRNFFAASLIAVASVAATSAFADTLDRDYPMLPSSPSTLTRAQVQAELLAAQKDGSVNVSNDHNYPAIAATGPSKTRAQVQAELVQALKDGSIPQYRS